MYIRNKKWREKHRFGGRRDLLFEQAHGKCEQCGMTEEEAMRRFGKRLSVHHKDGNGLNSEYPNHSLDNLMLLCISCHRSIHEEMKRGIAS
jgi:predicted HNH restriction endonuclease